MRGFGGLRVRACRMLFDLSLVHFVATIKTLSGLANQRAHASTFECVVKAKLHEKIIEVFHLIICMAHSQTSTDSHLFTAATWFGPGGQSIYSFFFVQQPFSTRVPPLKCVLNAEITSA